MVLVVRLAVVSPPVVARFARMAGEMRARDDRTLRQRISDAILEEVGVCFTEDELRFYTDVSMKAVADHAIEWCGGRDRDTGERVVPLSQLVEAR